MRVHPTKRSMPTNGSRGGENRTKPENPEWFRKNPGKALSEDYQQAIDRVIEKCTALQETEAKFGKPPEQEQGEKNMAAGSIYDSEKGKRPIRYSIDGRVVEGDIIDSRDSQIGTATTVGKGKATEGIPDDLLGAIRNVAGALVREKKEQQKSRTSIAEAIAKSRQLRQREELYPNPKNASIKVRREGILRTENARDRALFDADKGIQDLYTVLAHLVTILEKYGVAGKKSVMDAIYAMMLIDDEYPAALQPIGELLTEWGIELLIETFKQGGEMLSVFGLEESARAAFSRP
jgi:hypothetical protein